MSFLEKLKKGIGIEELTEEIPAEEKATLTQARKKPKKLEIKMEPIEPSEEPTAKESKAEDDEKKPETKKKWFEAEGQLAVDVYQTDEELVIQSAIAGVKPEDLDVLIDGDRVLINGERPDPNQGEKRNYFYQECYWGPFSRQIIMPVETDPSRAGATIKEGILIIRIPKIERQKKRKIVVKR